jgi:CRISPR/Cas system-associated exonuclease Cas4 (RecB family)
MASFKNAFSWSSSREKTFRDCLRKYYWHYYGSWEGWRAVAPSESRLAYRLKQITWLPMWAGSVVHETAEAALRAIRAGTRPSLDGAREQARTALNRGWFQSVNKDWQRDPKRSTNLFEHYYGQGVSQEDRIALREHVFGCLERFFETEAFARLRDEGPERWLALEELESFDLMGVPVWVVLDVAFRDGDGVTIVDWKSGRPRDEDKEQVKTYALYAMGRWRTTPERLEARLVYLKDGTETAVRPEASALIEHRERIGASIEEMRDCLVDVADNVAEIGAFPMIDAGAACSRCQFKQLCERE